MNRPTLGSGGALSAATESWRPSLNVTGSAVGQALRCSGCAVDGSPYSRFEPQSSLLNLAAPQPELPGQPT